MMEKIRIAGILMMAVGALMVSYKMISYRQSEKIYENLKDEVQTEVSLEDENAQTNVDEETEAYSVEIDELIRQNPDCVGWIHIPGLLDYPIVQTENNEFYLCHDFKENYNAAGCIFKDCRNQVGWEEKNNILYGHNMKNGAMFGALHRYEKQEFYETHKHIQIFTRDHSVKTYAVVSVKKVKKDADDYLIPLTEQELWDFLECMQSNSMHKTDLLGDVWETDRFLTLSTCSGRIGGDDRLVIHAVLIQEAVANEESVMGY